jgi:hypothetical protein
MFSPRFHQSPSEVLRGYLAKRISSKELERIFSEKNPAQMSTRTCLAVSPGPSIRILDEYLLEIFFGGVYSETAV